MKIQKKKPVQNRSKIIVDSIVQATARILESTPIDQISTNKMAQKAGVGIGSLYQYFLNRESVLDTVFEDMMEKNIRFYRQILTDNPNGTLKEILEIMTRQAFLHFLNQKGYLKALHSMQMMLGKSDNIVKFRMRLAQITAEEFYKRYPGMGTVEEIQAKVFMILCQNFGIIHTHIHASQMPLADEVLVQHMVNSAVLTLTTKTVPQ